MTSSDSKVCVITGTSSNLGINIAYRMLQEFPRSTKLTFVVTSRTLPKVTDVISSIQKYAYEKVPDRTAQLEFDYLLVDFTDMVSVLSAYYDLNKKYTKIDYFYVNSSQGVYEGINWLQSVKEIVANPIEGVTNPKYKIQKVGVKSGDGMGLVFQGNVFGPYYLLYKIRHLLQDGGCIVWISSVMGNPECLSFDDLQLVRSDVPYEGSKRSIDLMHIGNYKTLQTKYGITQHLVHPGIFTSFSFFQYLNGFTYFGMLLLFYLARFLGSPWHNISGYIAANAPLHVVTNASLDQSKKIGSATTRWGEEYLVDMDINSDGSENVLEYLDELCSVWDEKLKDQIVNTRQP